MGPPVVSKGMLSLSTRSALQILSLMALVLSSGCEETLLSVAQDQGAQPDLGSEQDASALDEGLFDQGPADLGTAPVDLGVQDSGEPDLGPLDLGPQDLGPPDLGLSDLGAPDQGAPDLGAPADLGPMDTGAVCGAVPAPTTALSVQGNLSLPRLIFNGARFAAVWYGDSTGTNEVYFAFVERDGTLVPGSITQVSPNNALSAFARIAWSGTEYGVVYSDDRGAMRQVYFARVSAAGALIPGSEVHLSQGDASEQYPAIAWDHQRSEWGIAWSAGTQGVRFARVDAQGAKIPASQIQVAAGSGISGYGDSPLLFNGQRFALTWTGPGGLFLGEIENGALVNSSVASVGESEVINPIRSTLAFDGNGEYGVAWSDYRSGTYTAYFARVAAGGGYIAGSERLLGTPGPYSSEVSVHYGNGEYLAIYHEITLGHDVWLARISGTSGQVSQRTNVTNTGGDQAWPTAVWDGCNVAVGFVDPGFGSATNRAFNLIFQP